MKLWIKGPDLEKNCCSCSDRNGSPCNSCGQCSKIKSVNSGNYSGDQHLNRPDVFDEMNVTLVTETGNIIKKFRKYFASGYISSFITDINFVNSPESLNSNEVLFCHTEKTGENYFDITINGNTLTSKHKDVKVNKLITRFKGRGLDIWSSPNLTLEGAEGLIPIDPIIYYADINSSNTILNAQFYNTYPYYTLALLKIKDQDTITFSSKFFHILTYNKLEQDNNICTIVPNAFVESTCFQPLIQPKIFDSIYSFLFNQKKKRKFDISFSQQSDNFLIPFNEEFIYYTTISEFCSTEYYHKYTVSDFKKCIFPNYDTIEELPPNTLCTNYEHNTILNYHSVGITGTNIFSESIYQQLVQPFYINRFGSGIYTLINQTGEYSSYTSVKENSINYELKEFGYRHGAYISHTASYTDSSNISFSAFDIINHYKVCYYDTRKTKDGTYSVAQIFGGCLNYTSEVNPYTQFNYNSKPSYANTQIIHTLEVALTLKDGETISGSEEPMYCLPILCCGPESSISINDKDGNPVDITGRLEKLQ